jgi:hypothetical protein
MTDKTYIIKIDEGSNPLSITRSDGACIPICIGNRDYQEYLKAPDESKIFELALEYTEDGKWSAIRSKRDSLLSACDWTQMPDSPKYQDQNWVSYRQALRDIMEQTDPFNIVWPVRPEE